MIRCECSDRSVRADGVVWRCYKANKSQLCIYVGCHRQKRYIVSLNNSLKCFLVHLALRFKETFLDYLYRTHSFCMF